jgi:hypothetical protein
LGGKRRENCGWFWNPQGRVGGPPVRLCRSGFNHYFIVLWPWPAVQLVVVVGAIPMKTTRSMDGTVHAS